MKLFISALVLWPENSKNSVFSIPFEIDKINVIHGRSRTGKSSIISIVDYCLGATRCAIPVGKIRNNVSWFGLILSIDGKLVLVARRTPGDRQTSKDFFLDPNFHEIPSIISVTHNEGQFKQAFNNLVRLTNLPLAEANEVGQFDGRPSYRDMAAFNFLPQHIVANPNTLFFKADSYQHKERLKRIMPFALGIINNEYLSKEREKAHLQRAYDDLVKQRKVLNGSMKAWDIEVQRHWDEAIELGLTSYSAAQSTTARLEELGSVNRLFLKGDLEGALSVPNFSHTNERLKEATTREAKWQKAVDLARREIRGLEQMAIRGQDLKEAVNKERARVINFDWLKEKIGKTNECVACGSYSNQLSKVIDTLDSEVNRVDTFAKALFESPVVDKEIDAAKKKLIDASTELHFSRIERARLQAIDNTTKDSLSKVYVLMGRIQSLLAAFATSNNTDDLSKQIESLARELKVLSDYLVRSDRIKREKIIDTELSNLIEFYADKFGLERRGDIRLDKVELTLSFQIHEKAKKEYLWEVGSGANWMGYHIATFLALHELLSREELRNSPVFRFLVIDQPSQVYFPSAVSGANILDLVNGDIKKLQGDRNEDIEATKRIFEMLSLGLKRARNQFQIIVLEHADSSIWGHCADTVEAANWKAPTDGLIPKEWILAEI